MADGSISSETVIVAAPAGLNATVLELQADSRFW
jgi:hypothetical protein